MSNDDNHSHADREDNETGHYHVDASGRVIDVSGVFVDNVIVHFTLDSTVDVSGVEVRNQQGQNAEGAEVTHTTLTTLDPSGVVQVTENLTQVVETYDDETDNLLHNQLLNQIKFYASEINCSDFQGKGTIDDYAVLFHAAAQIANESKQMQLDIDVEGFNEFGQAADDLSNLFSSFITKLQSVSIIDDTAFLQSIVSSLEKIVNLSKIFGKFKETILATSTINLPKSVRDTKVVLESVMDQLDCAMDYINYFVNPDAHAPCGSQLSTEEKGVIDMAVKTIDSWNVLCEQGVSIAMSQDTDIQFIHQANVDLENKTSTLRNATSILRAKFAGFNLSSQ